MIFSSKFLIFNLCKIEVLYYVLLVLMFFAPFSVLGQSPPDQSIDDYLYTRLTNPVMSVLLVGLLVALFFLVFFAIVVNHLSTIREDVSVTVFPLQTNHTNTRCCGVGSSVIDSFPTFVYSGVKGLKIGEGGLECVVCLSEFEDDETLCVIPKCDHVFHPDCIGAWLSSHVTCPVCRTNITEPDPVDQHKPITLPDSDVESQHPQSAVEVEVDPPPPTSQPQMMNVYDRRSGSFSGPIRVKFTRSHSTGHSIMLVQPGDKTERFTLKFPAEVRKQIFLNKKVNRSLSMVVMRGQGSSGEKKSDPWVFLERQSFMWRAGGGGDSSSSKSSNLVGSGSEESSVHA